MAQEGEDVRLGTEEDDQDEELEQHRRSRLWLGYSADNLRSNQDNERGRSRPQDEGRVSTPNAALSAPRNGPKYSHDFLTDTLRDVPNAEKRQTQPQKKPTSITKPSSPSGRISSGNSNEKPSLRPGATPSRLSRQRRESQAYEVPDDYENLDEIAAPSPIANPGVDRKQGYLEDRDHKPSGGDDGIPDEFENLDEVANPAPLEESKRKDTNDYLEDREIDGSPSTESEESKEKGPSTQRQRASKLATEIYTVSYLIFFSILGTLARLGLQALTFYPGAPVQTGLLWCNVGGSLIMGFLSEDRKLFRDEWGPGTKKKMSKGQGKGSHRSDSANQRHAAVKKTLPLYIGLATGFCGSFTSFSSFMRDAFFALSNALSVPINHPSSAPISPTVDVRRNPGYSLLAVLAVLIITVGLSLMAIQFGAHVALFLEPFTPSIPYLFARKIIDRSVVILAFGCWLAAIFMAIWPPDRPGGPVGNKSWAEETWRSQALFALVFAPPGCLLRFYASLHLNGRIKAFPLGTFVVNIFGTIMEAVFLDLQRVPVGGMVGCQVLQGMSDGFCGCLTTVSTWVAELTALRIKHAYFYGLMSVGVALSFMVIITGSLQWTKGFAHPLCTT